MASGASNRAHLTPQQYSQQTNRQAAGLGIGGALVTLSALFPPKGTPRMARAFILGILPTSLLVTSAAVAIFDPKAGFFGK